MRREGRHPRVERLVLLGRERVDGTERGDAPLEADDLALGALGCGRVELGRVVVGLVADRTRVLGDGRLTCRDLLRSAASRSSVARATATATSACSASSAEHLALQLGDRRRGRGRAPPALDASSTRRARPRRLRPCSAWTIAASASPSATSRRVSAAASRERAASSARRAASRRSSMCAPSAFARESTSSASSAASWRSPRSREPPGCGPRPRGARSRPSGALFVDRSTRRRSARRLRIGGGAASARRGWRGAAAARSSWTASRVERLLAHRSTIAAAPASAARAARSASTATERRLIEVAQAARGRWPPP